MKEKKQNRGFSSIRTTIAIVILMFCMPVTAQEKTSTGFFGSIKRATIRTVDFVDHILNSYDTLYVAGNRYNLTVMPQYLLDNEHYRFTSLTDGRQSIDIAPDGRHNLRLNLGWRWLLVGYSYNLKGDSPQFNFNTSLYTARLGLDLFYRKCDTGYRICGLNGFYDGNTQLKNYNKDFEGLNVSQLGIELCYAFNKRYSYAATHGRSTIQRKSAGSLQAGAGYNRQRFTFDHEKLDPFIEGQLTNGLKFKEAAYNDISIHLGYCYNWVFAKNFLACLSLSPALGYKFVAIRSIKDIISKANIGFNMTSRAALLYNNGRYYAGASFVSHTYHYNKEELSILNSFGILKVYVGYNFWRRK
jgi:hypothetical protein